MISYNNYEYENIKASISSKKYIHNGVCIGEIFLIECNFSKNKDSGYFCFYLNEIHDNFNVLSNKEYKGNLTQESLKEFPIIDIIEFANNDKFDTLYDGEYYIKFSNIVNNKININLTIKDNNYNLKLETDLECRGNL